MISLLTKTFLFFFATSYTVAYADRLAGGFHEAPKLYIFDSPLYDPLSGVAMHVQQFVEDIPSIKPNLEGSTQRSKIMRISRRLNRVNPILQHIVVLTTSPQGFDTSEATDKNLDTALQTLRSILTEAHGETIELVGHSNDVLFLNTMKNLLNSIQNALYHASDLSPKLFSKVDRSYPMMEKFIIHEYVPHAEKVYAIKMNLDKTQNKSYKIRQEDVEKLIDQWNEAHDRIKESSINLLKLVDIMKNSVQKNGDREALQHLSAFISLLKDGDYNIFDNLTPDVINHRLDRIEKNLFAISHRNNPVVQKKSKSVSLPMAISMMIQIENMVEKLTHLHNDLHTTQEKLSYLAARLNRSKVEGYDSIIKRNNAIRSQLNRLHNDISMVHTALRKSMTNSITTGISKNPFQIDFVSLKLRFAELEKKIKSNDHAKRFIKELEEIRLLLFKLFNDSKRFNRFQQIMETQREKVINETKKH